MLSLVSFLLLVPVLANAEALQIRSPIYEALLAEPSSKLQCLAKNDTSFGFQFERKEEHVSLQRIEHGKIKGEPLAGKIERENKIPEYFMLRFRETHENGGSLLSFRVLTRRNAQMQITGSAFFVEFQKNADGKEDYYPAGSIGLICSKE
jgi:hypothetical protein